MHKYREVTIENTMKLLIRCKLGFHSRQLLFDILKAVIHYEMQAVHFKDTVARYSRHKVEQEDYDVL